MGKIDDFGSEKAILIMHPLHFWDETALILPNRSSSVNISSKGSERQLHWQNTCPDVVAFPGVRLVSVAQTRTLYVSIVLLCFCHESLFCLTNS